MYTRKRLDNGKEGVGLTLGDGALAVTAADTDAVDDKALLGLYVQKQVYGAVSIPSSISSLVLSRRACPSTLSAYWSIPSRPIFELPTPAGRVHAHPDD